MVHNPGVGVEGYLRVAAMSIALYDALWTLPTEISIYREQKSFRKMTRSCILFILIRYSSILVIVVGNVGFFYDGFTAQSCHKFFLLTPLFKIMQTMIAQVIMALRTIAVARHTRWVVWVVSIAFIITVILEFFSNIWARFPFQEPKGATLANCSSGNINGLKVVWVHYLAVMLYDLTCLAIATGFIYAQSRKVPNYSVDHLTKMLLKEGLLYFTYLTTANILNFVLYLLGSSEVQSSGATLGYTVTWIMSQRLLIHLHEFKTSLRIWEAPIPKNQTKSNFYIPRSSNTSPNSPQDDVELGVHITIEENVKVDYEKEIEGGILTQHRFSAQRMGGELRKCEQPRINEEDIAIDGYDDISQRSCTGPGKGWEVTTVGKIFSP